MPQVQNIPPVLGRNCLRNKKFAPRKRGFQCCKQTLSISEKVGHGAGCPTNAIDGALSVFYILPM